MFSSNMDSVASNRLFISSVVYISLLLDNILLTVIVPILPDFLAQISNDGSAIYNVQNSMMYSYKNYDLHYLPNILSKHPVAGSSVINMTASVPDDVWIGGRVTDNKRRNLEDENGSIGILLAVKAIVQLFFNPIVGSLTSKYGYRKPIVLGTFCLLITSLVFAYGESYMTLFFARALQGVASACIGVAGMSLVAQMYPEEDKRSKVMGIILGSIALGVLLGYPLGGILYDFVGKSAPFYILSVLIFITLTMQLLGMDLNVPAEVVVEVDKPKWLPLLTDKMILLITCAIFVSTSAMAILEPCLPIWLITNLNPKKWQLGTVFIPDSIGYFIGTNFFGSVAYKLGQIKVSMVAILLVGLSSIMIPIATSVTNLLIPHFGLGLGIGTIDAALVPLLATLVDSKYSNDDDSVGSDTFSNYGAVYAIQQMAVCLAYSFGPIVGGEIAQTIGFAWLMRIVGITNLVFAPIMLMLSMYSNLKGANTANNDILLQSTEPSTSRDYKRFYNTMQLP